MTLADSAIGPTTTVDARVATSAFWTDSSSGIAEEATFLGSDGAKILAFLHLPAVEPAIAGVVLCGSLYEDLTVNYRKELLIARELARRGVATVRFQYRGSGNSDRLADDAVTFDSMVADAELALSWLSDRTGVSGVTMVGFRMGALVAEHLAARDDATPLVLWSPTLAGADFFKGMSRATMVAGVREAAARKKSATVDSGAGLPAEDSVEMLGYRVSNTSRDDLSARTLPDITSSGRPVQFIQIGLAEELPAAQQRFVTAWRDAGADVSVLLVRVRQQWFVPDEFEPEDAKPESNTLALGLAAWIEDTARRSR